MRTVRYHPEARAEFLHYAAISPRLAQRYDRAVHAAEVSAATTPEAWSKYKYKTRRVVERRFKFSLVYLHSDNEIHVVAVPPTQRKPGYWRTRLGNA